MDRWLAGLAMLALGGCDYILGLRHFDHDDAQNIDAPLAGPAMVTGTYRVHWIDNDPAGLPQPHNDPPAATTTASVRFADGAVQVVALEAGGAFSFTNPHANQAFALDVKTAYIDTEYQLDATALKLVERFGGRIDRTPVPANTSVLVNVMGGTTGSVKEELHTTGVWSRSGLDVDPIDWTTVAAGGGPMGLLDGTKHDAAYFAHYMTDGTGFTRLDSYLLFPDQTTRPMMTTSLTGFVNDLTTNQCTHVVSSFELEVERAVALHTGALAGFSGWQINAVPSSEFALLDRFPLVYALDPGHIDVSPMYGNPYGTGVDASTLLFLVYPGTHTSATTSTEITTVVPIAANTCGGPATAIPQQLVAIPIDVTLAGTSLVADDTPTISIDRAAPVPVAWTSSPGTADYYAVVLEQVSNGTYTPVYTIITTNPYATIDPDRLQASVYRLSVHAYLGTPRAADGNFTDLATPAVDAVEQTLNFKVN